MKKTVLVYGSISGTLVALMLIISFVFILGNDPNHNMTGGMIIGFTSQFLAMSFIFIATHSYKTNVLGGRIKFWPALKIGLLISFIASTMYVITWVILYKTGSSVVIDGMAQKEIGDLIAQKAPQAAIDEAKSRWEFYSTYPGLISFTYMEILPTGILMSLISATIFSLIGRKKKDNTATA
jgi:hypothetical protein